MWTMSEEVRAGRCDRCVIALPAFWGTCPLCGDALSIEAKAAEDSDADAPQPTVADADPAGAPAVDGETWECMVCSKAVDAADERCRHCGTVFDPMQFSAGIAGPGNGASVSADVPRILQEGSHFITTCRCPLCWSTVACATDRCTMCGTSFATAGSGRRGLVSRLA